MMPYRNRIVKTFLGFSDATVSKKADLVSRDVPGIIHPAVQTYMILVEKGKQPVWAGALLDIAKGSRWH
jgi:hypothetical protein